MKTQIKKLTQVIETSDIHPVLLHFLSPLEVAAYKNRFKKMTYTIEGVDLVLEPFTCNELLLVSRKHVEKLRRIIVPARIKLLKKSDPEIKRFLSKPLKYQELPTRIYQILARNYCRKMEEVALHGEYGLTRMRGLGKESVKYVITRFNENGCGSLFI